VGRRYVQMQAYALGEQNPCTLYRRRGLISSLSLKKRAGAACYGEDRDMSLACSMRGAVAGKDDGALR
jgi:hypothetical protein